MSLIRFLLIEGLLGSSYKATTRMIRDPVVVGIRTDSATNPILFISGITRPSVLAAPVVVKMILFMILLFFLKSVAPASGNLSSTSWFPVAAWIVAIEALSIFLVPK